MFLFIILFAGSLLLNIAISIFIMVKKWQNNWSLHNKITYGLLSLVLLPFIGIIIFSIKSKKNCQIENSPNDLKYNEFIEEPFDIKSISEIDLYDDE